VCWKPAANFLAGDLNRGYNISNSACRRGGKPRRPRSHKDRGLCSICVGKLGVYVDGYNVYYRSLRGRGPRHKWLDLQALVERKFKGDQVDRIVYCTARVSDQQTAARQDRYLRALASKGVEVVEGQFKIRDKKGFLVDPPPTYIGQKGIIRAPEEKRSDVNLATHLLVDAYEKKFDEAVVMSMDTDLALPISHVVTKLGLPVHLFVMGTHLEGGVERKARVAYDLRQAGVRIKRYDANDIKASQLPGVLVVGPAQIVKPPHW
jgi:uncharacterized LabA/DUF88 family protein